MLKLLATFVTFIACTMASAAAWDRGGTILDRLLLVSISVVIVLAVHLLPGLSKRRSTWLVWIACLVAAIYGHLSFLTHASLRAATLQAEQSAAVQGVQKQIQTVQSSLDLIHVRPISTVNADLAATRNWRLRESLLVELAEAKRAEKLKTQLVQLYGQATIAQVAETHDPVVSRLAGLTGIQESTVAVGIGLILSILVELVGSLLWYEALSVVTEVTPSPAMPETPVTREEPVTIGSNDVVTMLRNAIEAGYCKATVASIRGYLACSQERAMILRRELALH